MKPDKNTDPSLNQHLAQLRALRGSHKNQHRRPRQRRLSPAEREAILAKTGGKCHICGGEMEETWNADHIHAHSTGGEHAVDNYLPAHAECNNVRWDYLPEEFRIILRLGVWARTQIENGTPVGKEMAEGFSKHEANRLARRKSG